jgi:hypothetical protein
MEYLNKKPFTVPVGKRPPNSCQGMHIWLDLKGRCVFCGEQVKPEPVAEKKPS